MSGINNINSNNINNVNFEDDDNDDYGSTDDGDIASDVGLIMGSNDDFNTIPNIDSNTNNDINFKINANKNRMELLEKLKNIDEFAFGGGSSGSGGDGNNEDSANGEANNLDELTVQEENFWKEMENIKNNENENYPVGSKRNALVSAISRRSRKAKESKTAANDFVPSISAGESHGRS